MKEGLLPQVPKVVGKQRAKYWEIGRVGLGPKVRI